MDSGRTQVGPRDPALGVIVPAFNEEATIGGVMQRVLLQPCVQQVVVVDDASTDRTLEVAQGFADDPRVTVVRHPANRGKGAALRTGLSSVTAPIVIVQDADMEYDPVEYPGLIEPIVEGRADVVYGVRGFMGQTAYSYWFVIGNRMVTTATNVLFNCYIQDMETGFKAMRTELMRRLGLRGRRFDIEPEITARLLRLGYRIHEVPISYYARSRAEGKKLTWRDGVSALGTLLQLRLTPHRRLFGAPDEYHRQRLDDLARAPRLPELPGERRVGVSSGLSKPAGR
ncbi:MAG TPA: glycosyltransferase family 2 protein [Candidatus Dormibacteraeota bacterium]|nr:glycosyltransferase family 2 protein [Candidatus Dormibacteraeota bacterium]